MSNITNYERYLFMSLRYGYKDMSVLQTIPTERVNARHFIDIAERNDCPMLVPATVGTEADQQIDAFLCYVCAYTPINVLAEELYNVGAYAVGLNYRLEIGVHLTFERLNNMQLAAKDYLSRTIYRALSFVNFLDSKDMHYVAICKNYEVNAEIYELLMKPEVAGCIYIIQHYATSGALFFPKMLGYFAETSQLVLDTELLMDEMILSQDEISGMEVMRKVTLLFTVLRRDPGIVTEIWKRFCTEDYGESLESVVGTAKAFMDDCGIVETRW